MILEAKLHEHCLKSYCRLVAVQVCFFEIHRNPKDVRLIG